MIQPAWSPLAFPRGRGAQGPRGRAEAAEAGGDDEGVDQVRTPVLNFRTFGKLHTATLVLWLAAAAIHRKW